MKTKESALEVMESLRRRWIDELSNAVQVNEEHLRQALPGNGDPFACDGRLAALAQQIVELQTLIDAMDKSAAQRPGRQMPGVASFHGPSAENASLFDRFIACVGQLRHDDAVRELAKIIPLRLDHLATATYYFTRALRAQPSLGDQLNDLYQRLDQLNDADAARILIRTLGFQAIEARFAVETLRRIRQDASEHSSAGAFRPSRDASLQPEARI